MIYTLKMGKPKYKEAKINLPKFKQQVSGRARIIISSVKLTQGLRC